MTAPLLVPAAIWLLVLTAVGFARAWKTAAVMNGLAVAGVLCVLAMANHLNSNEDTDQAGLGALILAGLAIVVAAAGLVGTALGWLLSVVMNAGHQYELDIEGPSE